MKQTLLMLVLAMGAAGAWAVEPLKDRTSIQIDDSETAWLDVRKTKIYDLREEIPVSHSASNWVNVSEKKAQAAAEEDEATVSWTFTNREIGMETVSTNCTDDVSLKVTLNAPGEYEFTHQAADGSLVSTNLIVGWRQLGTEAEPWMVGATGHEVEVTAWTNGTAMLVVEGKGVADWAPWGPVAGGINELVKDKGVVGLDGIMASLPALTTVNGLTLGELAYAGMVGAAKVGFSTIAVEGGTAQLGVVVSTNGDLTAATESWGKAKVKGATVVDGEAILTIPVPADKGFFIINPKPDVPSNLDLPPIVTVK